jgi:hypothetical protein
MQPLAPLPEIFAPAKRIHREGEWWCFGCLAGRVSRFSLFEFRFSAFGGMVAPIAFPEA